MPFIFQAKVYENQRGLLLACYSQTFFRSLCLYGSS